MDTDITEDLVQACFDGDIERVRTLIDSGAEINPSDQGWPPLHAAIENMWEDVVRFLVRHGASLTTTCLGFSPLHHAIDIEIDTAAQSNATEPPEPVLTEILLSAGSDINAQDDYGETPLQMATRRGHKKAMIALAAWGARAS
ncbi:MAG: ankyrin repeat domain-containing protein [Candidatus Kapaibacterium sp.]